MGYETMWSDHAPNVLVIKAIPPKDWDSFHAAARNAIAMAHTTDGPVGIIFDMREAPEPAGSDILNNLRKQIHSVPPNVVMVVTCGYEVMERTVVDMLRQAFGEAYQSVDTMEEAYMLIAERIA